MSAALDYTIEEPSEQTAVAIIPRASVPTILAMDGAPDILKALADELATFKADISTPKGRKAIASMADKVSTAKMDIVRLANATTENWRTWTKNVVAERKDLEDRMNVLKAQVRQPLTDFEDAEKERLQGHEEALAQIGDMITFDERSTSAEIERHLVQLSDLPARDWQEFARRAQEMVTKVKERLTSNLDAAVKREAEAAELERLRAEQAERNRLAAIREQAEREAQIATQAAEQARLAAEAKAAAEAAEAARKAEEERVAAERAAQAERDRIEREAKEAAEAARREQDRIAAEAKAAEERASKAERDRLAAIETARLAAEKAERDRKAAAEKAEQDRIAAEERAEKRRLEAIEAERKRVADEKEAEERAAAAREKDRAHKSKIMREAKEALIEHTKLDEATAISVVKAIVACNIPHTSVRF